MLGPLVAIVAGIASGGLYVGGLASTVAGVFMILLSALPIYIAGLGWGSTAGGVAAAIASLGIMALLKDPLMASVFVVGFALPAFVLLHLATSKRVESGREHWFPANALLPAVAIVGLVQVLVLAATLSLTRAGLVGTARESLQQVLALFMNGAGTTAFNQVVDQWQSLVPGLIVAAALLAQVLSGTVAQGLVNSFGRALRPTPAFWRLKLPAWPSYLMIAALLVALVSSGFGKAGGTGTAAVVLTLAMAFVLVLGVVFLVQGLAVLHALTRGMRAQLLVLAGAYLVVLAFPPFGPAAFVAVGFAERWGNFRERFGADLDADMED